MNVLFMTIGRMADINNQTLYCDLLRTFRDNGHSVYTISPFENRAKKKALYNEIHGAHMLHVKTGTLTGQVGLFKKGVAYLSLEKIFTTAIKKFFCSVKFDLIIYSTPPITFCNAIQCVKKRDNAKTYLLIKDIFPQNAVDLGMMRTAGVKGLLYRYFRSKEKKLYAISDRIGCMSQANCKYLIEHNPEVSPDKVAVCPNAVEPNPIRLTDADRRELRTRYGIPTDKTVFVYGGNLGKPQGIPFLMDCLTRCADNADAFFLIVGNGTEYGKLAAFMDETKPSNAKLLQRLPKEDYDRLVAACDVGLIFLDHRFTIPNFPSRLLSYMQAGLPVLAATDTATDIGTVITSGGFGWWCESNSTADFAACVDAALLADRVAMGAAGQAYLQEHYTAEKAYETIMKAVNP